MTVVSDEIAEEIARTLYSQLKTDPGLRLKLEEVCDLLARATHALGRVYICIDALDECLDKNKKPLLDDFKIYQLETTLFDCFSPGDLI